MQRTLRSDPIQVSPWKRQLPDGVSELFISGKQSKDKDEGLDQVRTTDITYIPMRKGFFTWWRLLISSPGISSSRNSQTS